MKERLILQDAWKTRTIDQDKILPPEETVARFRKKLEGIKPDILRETRRIDNGRLDIPVYFSICGKDAAATIGTGKQMGKGADPDQAEASAVMELAERFSFFSFRNDPTRFRFARYADLGDSAISFEAVAGSVHDESGDLDCAREFFEDLPLRWTKGFNLTRDEALWVPFDWFFMINEFNGPCAGNCREEALLQGICEVVERHVSSVISRERLPAPGIDPLSATDPAVVEMIRKYEAAGITLHLSDFTMDMGIPSVGVLAYDLSTFPEKSEIVWTAGTAPDPEKAMSRALTETAQLAGDFDSGANYVASGLPKPTSLSQVDFIRRPPCTVSIRDLPNLSHGNMRVEVERCISALAAKKMEVIVIDTTHPELEVPAFYTVIPGAHFRERARGTSVGMFTAKYIAENSAPESAVKILENMSRKMGPRYYLSFYMGNLHIAMGDYPCALNHLSAALDLDPHLQDIPSIYSYMGVCFKEMGEYDKALSVLEKGKALDAGRTDIHNLMGFCLFRKKEHEAAIGAFMEVIRIDPNSAIDYANIGVNYRELGDKEKAAAFFRTALSIDPSIGFARDALAGLAGK